MNSIYKKLALTRVKLQTKNIKKSGKNKFANYTYYELGDFLPAINELCNDVGLLPVIHFDNDEAIMTIYDIESDKTITFRSKIADATTKGQLPIQSLGSIHTYMRRYLYLLAFEIVEHDFIESVAGNIELPPRKITKQEYNVMMELCSKMKYDTKRLNEYMLKNHKAQRGSELNIEQYEDCIMEIESNMINAELENDLIKQSYEV